MERPNNPFQFPFDWEQFQRYFGWSESFPPPEATDTAAWIEAYVQDMLDKTLPPAARRRPKPQAGRPEVSETQHKVLIRIKVPDSVDPSDIKVYVKTDQVKLEGLSEQAQLIKLPAYVDTRACKALCKDRLIRLQMQKLPADGPFRRIEVKTIL